MSDLLDKRFTLKKLLKAFQVQFGLSLDMTSENYADVATGITLWLDIIENQYKHRPTLKQIDYNCFNAMQSRNNLNHCGVVKCMLMFVIYIRNTKQAVPSDFYISKLSKFAETMTHKNSTIFYEHDFDNYVAEQRERQEA